MPLDLISIAVDKCSAWEAMWHRLGKRRRLAGAQGQTAVLNFDSYFALDDEKEGFVRIPSDMREKCPAQFGDFELK